MKILAIDVGDRRIGLAISDELGIVAKPLGVIKNDAKVRHKLYQMIKDYGVKKVIVGIPYTLRGEIGNQAKKVTRFIKKVLNKGVIEELGVEVLYLDERFTTKISHQIKDKKEKDKEIDDITACVILTNYLDNPNSR